MYGKGYFAPQSRQGVQMYMPPAQQDRPLYPSTSFQTSTTTSQSYMVHQGYSSVTAHLCHPESTTYSHLSQFPVPPSGTPHSGHFYSIPPPHLHLSFPSAQQDPQWTRNVNQIPPNFPQPSLLSPGQAPSRGLVWPTFPVVVQGVQPTVQLHPPLSSSMLNAHAFGSVAYTAPQVFHMPSALVPSLPPPPPPPPPPPRVPPPLSPSSPVGLPHACVMSSATLLPFSSQINQVWYDPSSRPGLFSNMRNTCVSHLNTDSDIDMEDDITRVYEEHVIYEKLHEPQLPTLQTQNSLAKILFSSEVSVLGEGIKGSSSHGDARTTPMPFPARSPVMRLQSFGGNNASWKKPSYHLQDHPTTDSVPVNVDEPEDNGSLKSSYQSNSVDREQSVQVYMQDDESNTAADVGNKADDRNKKNKRSKSLKRFEAVLAKFVKVLHPSWRRSDMSRFTFRKIVKKTVDKVSGSLKHHHIPKSQAMINRYIESSRSKLTSLVMAYVDKYVTGYKVTKY